MKLVNPPEIDKNWEKNQQAWMKAEAAARAAQAAADAAKAAADALKPKSTLPQKLADMYNLINLQKDEPTPALTKVAENNVTKKTQSMVQVDAAPVAAKVNTTVAAKANPANATAASKTLEKVVMSNTTIQATKAPALETPPVAPKEHMTHAQKKEAKEQKKVEERIRQ